MSAPITDDGNACRRALAREAAEWYRPSGLFAHRFARGKLNGDPAYIGLVERRLIADNARILDLGCGQALLVAWLLAARARYDAGDWPGGWPAPPRLGTFTGIELMQSDIDRARRALGDRAQRAFGDRAQRAFGDRVTLIAGDIRTVPFAAADTAIILDVLHYMDVDDQMAVLERVRDALRASRGTLLVRVGDAAAGLPFHLSLGVDRTVTFIRGHRLPKMHCRPLADWTTTLQSLGFAVEAIPMSAGTPFANVLLAARL